MIERPERRSNNLVRLSRCMYLKSGYYKRLAKYYSTMPKYYWTVDTEVRSVEFKKTEMSTIESRLYKFISAVNKLRLEQEIERIFLTAFVEDVCYGYLVETDSNSFIFYLPSKYCEIKKIVNGLYGFALKINNIPIKTLSTFPPELRQIIEVAKCTGKSEVMVPYDKSICFKYNDHLPYVYPPLFHLISDILDIDDYKGLYKAKTEQDCYRLISFEIPTRDGNILMDDKTVVPFVQMTKDIVPESIGVIPTPMKLNAIQFKSDQAERDKVKDVTDQLYAEAGVSQALMAGATNGSELATAIKADSGDIFRMYRQIERMVNLHMQMRNMAVYTNYMFSFSMIDVTIFNEDEVVDRELKLAQASAPNKMRLLASAGINPAKLLGNMVVENDILNLSDGWTVLKTSATQTADDQTVGGRPKLDEADLSVSGSNARNNDSNNPNNRTGD